MCSPPPRAQADQEALWRALALGDLQAVSSDHAPYAFDETGKLRAGPSPNFKQIANGMPGLEARLPLLFDAMVSNGRLGRREVRRAAPRPRRPRSTTCTRARARSPSARDADIAIWDPQKQRHAHRRMRARPRRLHALCRPHRHGLAGDGAAARRGDRRRRRAARDARLRPLPAAHRRRRRRAGSAGSSPRWTRPGISGRCSCRRSSYQRPSVLTRWRFPSRC